MSNGWITDKAELQVTESILSSKVSKELGNELLPFYLSAHLSVLSSTWPEK